MKLEKINKLLGILTGVKCEATHLAQLKQFCLVAAPIFLQDSSRVDLNELLDEIDSIGKFMIFADKPVAVALENKGLTSDAVLSVNCISPFEMYTFDDNFIYQKAADIPYPCTVVFDGYNRSIYQVLQCLSEYVKDTDLSVDIHLCNAPSFSIVKRALGWTVDGSGIHSFAGSHFTLDAAALNEEIFVSLMFLCEVFDISYQQFEELGVNIALINSGKATAIPLRTEEAKLAAQKLAADE